MRWQKPKSLEQATRSTRSVLSGKKDRKLGRNRRTHVSVRHHSTIQHLPSYLGARPCLAGGRAVRETSAQSETTGVYHQARHDWKSKEEQAILPYRLAFPAAGTYPQGPKRLCGPNPAARAVVGTGRGGESLHHVSESCHSLTGVALQGVTMVYSLGCLSALRRVPPSHLPRGCPVQQHMHITAKRCGPSLKMEHPCKRK
jgi:hypothetical protein